MEPAVRGVWPRSGLASDANDASQADQQQTLTMLITASFRIDNGLFGSDYSRDQLEMIASFLNDALASDTVAFVKAIAQPDPC
jgi:hypothetical protein